MTPPVPRLMLIADRGTAESDEDWLDLVRRLASLELPVSTALQLRVREPAEGPRTDLLEAGMEAARDGGGLPVLVNGTVEQARELAAHGVHWPEREIPGEVVGEASLLVGASIHGPGEALENAAAAGADYVVFAPVFRPRSKSGTGRGVDALREVVEASELPVLALGGVDTARVRECLGAGARGVAVVGAVMLAPDPPAAARQIADRLATTLDGQASDSRVKRYPAP